MFFVEWIPTRENPCGMPLPVAVANRQGSGAALFVKPLENSKRHPKRLEIFLLGSLT
jgi:hypothetical protein